MSSLMMCYCQGIDHGSSCRYFQARQSGEIQGRAQAQHWPNAQEAEPPSGAYTGRLAPDGPSWPPYPHQYNPPSGALKEAVAVGNQKESARIQDAQRVVAGPCLGTLGTLAKEFSLRSLASLKLRRSNYIVYLRDRIDDEDWHAVSDAANDLRELDVEIRLTEGR